MDDRITLWRNTLHLFYESKKPPYIGPFKQAGLSKIVIDSPFITTDSKEMHPDIVSSGGDGWIVLEITTKPSSKECQLNFYTQINPRNLGTYGLRQHTKEPDVICARLEPATDGPFCQLILRDRLQFNNEACIKNNSLRKALNEANDRLDLHKLPNISIVIVPEMAGKSKELRRGIFDIVMQLFAKDCEGKTVEQIVKEGLDKINTCISPRDRSSLESSVKTQMDVLVRDHLSEYLMFDETTRCYKVKEHADLHANTKGSIVRELKKWAGGDRSLEEFSEEDPA